MRNLLQTWLLLRPGEGGKTAYFLLLNLILGVGMAIGRASAEAIFFNRVGVDQLPRFYILLSISLLLASMIYAAFVDRLSAERLMRGFSVILLLLLLATGVLIQFVDGDVLYYGYLLLYELVSEILIIHMAHYLVQNLDLGQGKRLMPTILAGNQIGMIVGSLVVATFSNVLPTEGFIYLWAAAVLTGLVLLQWWHRHMGRSPYYYPKPQRRGSLARTAQEIGQGARALWTIPLARAGAVTLFLLVIVFYLLTFAVNKVYAETFPDEQALVAFFGWLNAGLGLAAIIIQLTLSNRIFQRLGIKRTSLIYPIGNVVSFGALLVSFSLLPALLGSIARGVLMPAFHASSSSLINSVMSRRMLGRVQAAMLGLVMPLALVVCGVALDGLVKHYPFEWILWLGAVVSLLYLASNLWRSRCYHRELVGSLKDSVFLRHIGNHGVRPEADVLALMTRQLDVHDKENALVVAEMLARYAPDIAEKKLGKILDAAATPLRDQLLNLAIEHRLHIDSQQLVTLHNRGDDHLRATILRLLSVRGEVSSDSLARGYLAHDNPRLQAEAIRHLIAIHGTDPVAISTWQTMFNVNLHGHQHALATLADLVAALPSEEYIAAAYQQLFATMLMSSDARSMSLALDALSRWSLPVSGEVAVLLEQQLSGTVPVLRQKAYRCLALIPREKATAAAWLGLENSQPEIRRSSLAFLEQHCGLSPDDVVRQLSGEAIGHPRQVAALLDYVESKGLPRHAYEAMADGLLAEAERYAAVEAWMVESGEQSARGEVLMHTLRERYYQMLDAALAALQGCESREELRIVRAILASRDQGSCSRAGEVIGHIQNRELGRRIMVMLEQAGSFDQIKQHYRHLFGNRDEAKNWCKTRRERWVTELVAG